MEKFEIFGIQTSKRFSDFTEHFTESDWSDDESLYYEGKKTFEHVDDGFSFKYKFIIECYERFWENKEDYTVCLTMVILPESCKNLKEVAACCGIDEDEVTWYDLLGVGGYCVGFGQTICEKEEIEETVLKISHVYETMDGLRGFTFDKVWNGIGTTGWDVIKHAVLGKKLF